MDFILDDDEDNLFLENQLIDDDIQNEIYLFDKSIQQMLLDIPQNVVYAMKK